MFIKIEVKDNNVEQALRVLKRKLQKDGFYKIIKLKNTMTNNKFPVKIKAGKTMHDMQNMTEKVV